jgi:hypothetical protein
LNEIDVDSHQQNGLDYIQKAADLNDTFGLHCLVAMGLQAIHSYEAKEVAFPLFAKSSSRGDTASTFPLMDD